LLVEKKGHGFEVDGGCLPLTPPSPREERGEGALGRGRGND
jgi:hypothetical protein